ncbi:UNVERIFIED_ORG: putative RecA/RadA family phage recombinase [Stenotrophomonas maltophilia]
MAKNYKFPGAVIDIVAASALVSGQASVVGQLLAVALVDIPAGTKGSAQIEGVFELPKLANANIAAGAGLTWDAQGGKLIVTGADAGDLENCAVAIAVAGAGTSTVLAKLTPGSGSVKSA